MDREMGPEGLAAGLALSGISRSQAAKALHLSTSQLNKKLRGRARVYEDERRKLLMLMDRQNKRGKQA